MWVRGGGDMNRGGVGGRASELRILGGWPDINSQPLHAVANAKSHSQVVLQAIKFGGGMVWECAPGNV